MIVTTEIVVSYFRLLVYSCMAYSSASFASVPESKGGKSHYRSRFCEKPAPGLIQSEAKKANKYKNCELMT